MIQIAGTTEISDRLAYRGKGKAVASMEDLRCIGDSLGLCHWLTRATFGLPQHQVGLIEAVTGRAMTPEELRRAGERIYNLEHLFNLREGATPADDVLPERFLREPMPRGPGKGHVCELEPMLEEYYAARAWDPETGFPSDEKLMELDVSSVPVEHRREWFAGEGHA